MKNERTRAITRGAGIFLAGAVFAGSLLWAGGAVMRPAEDPLETESIALIEVAPGVVGSSISLAVIAEWVAEPVGVNRAVGVVTGVDIDQGAELSQSSVVYRVNEHPVMVARGEVPAYRDISSGAQGDDVRQLQEMLTDLGFFSGDVDGEAGATTVSAIREWQESVGIEQTGVIDMSTLIFVPTLPTRVTLDMDIVYRGASLSGGEQILSGLPTSPQFTLPVTTAQAQLIPAGTRVEVTSPDSDGWTAVAGEPISDADSGVVSIDLLGPDGDAICGEQCQQVSVTGRQSLTSTIVTAETVEGLVIPSSALVSTASGDLAVVDEAGERIAVTVVASARGMSVVEGVDAGTQIRVPGESSP